jgi:hypothetical protein
VHRREYQNLLPTNAYFNYTGASKIPIRSTDQEGVNATAQAFARGMLGENMTSWTSWLVTPDSLVGDVSLKRRTMISLTLSFLGHI